MDNTKKLPCTKCGILISTDGDDYVTSMSHPSRVWCRVAEREQEIANLKARNAELEKQLKELQNLLGESEVEKKAAFDSGFRVGLREVYPNDID